MGLMEPGEAPDTFFISAPQRTPEGGYTGGTDVPLRIADIIGCNGPRTGPMRRELEAILIRWFDVATRGRMKVVAVL